MRLLLVLSLVLTAGCSVAAVSNVDNGFDAGVKVCLGETCKTAGACAN